MEHGQVNHTNQNHIKIIVLTFDNKYSLRKDKV